MDLHIAPQLILSDKLENLKIDNYGFQEAMSLHDKPPNDDSYTIRIIKDEEMENVLKHLRNFFYKDEPINEAVKLIPNEESRCLDLEYYSTKCIHEGVSLMAVTPKGKIVGVSLNGIWENGQSENDDYEITDAKFKKIVEFLDYLELEGTRKIEKLYDDVNKMIFCKILSVDSDWRGKGIAKNLLDNTRKLGVKEKCDLMRVDATSHFTSKAISRLGFECVYEIYFADYKENGKPVFCPEYPHVACGVYVQNIATECSKII